MKDEPENDHQDRQVPAEDDQAMECDSLQPQTDAEQPTPVVKSEPKVNTPSVKLEPQSIKFEDSNVDESRFWYIGIINKTAE